MESAEDCNDFIAFAGSSPLFTICSSCVSAAALTWVHVVRVGGDLVSASWALNTASFASPLNPGSFQADLTAGRSPAALCQAA